MSSVAAVLLLLSAFTHAGWNYLSKKDHPTIAYYLVANTAGTLCILPILAFFWLQIPRIPIDVWIIAAVSGFFLAACMAALAGAYSRGDISIAYPIARSLPVLLVTAITMVFDLGTELEVPFVFGALLVSGGCLILPMADWRHLTRAGFSNLCCLLAVAAAVCIAGYTILDHAALARLRCLPEEPMTAVDATLIYMVIEAICVSVWQGGFVLCSRRERSDLRTVLTGFKASAALTGIGIYLTYGLVLAAMCHVTNVSYVAAFRQISIPLGAVFGMAFLHEPRYMPKITGIVLIAVGLGILWM